MLRTIFVLLLIAVGLVYSVQGAFPAMLFYLWIAYFRPDDWIWGSWVTDLNLSLIVGTYVILATVFSKNRFHLGIGSALILLFLAHTALSIPLSPVLTEYVHLWPSWTDFARKVLVGLCLTVLVTTEERLRAALLVIAVSLSFEGAKQGWVQLFINPGGVNINTSPFLGDNNGVAVGMLMLIPILTALAATTSRRWERYGARFLVVGVLYRAIATYSRGGFLSALALGLHYLVRAKRKMRAVIALVFAVGIIAPALPTAFWGRMGTIQTAAQATDEGQLDESQASRLHFWRVATVMANDRPFIGVGFDAYNYVYNLYDFRNGEFGTYRSVHSAWFGLLAELGYVGLGLFILLIARTFYVTRRARRLAKARPDLASLVAYGTALEAALLTFMVGGSFVPFQYNEMLWHFIALSIVFDRLIRERLAAPAVALPSLQPEERVRRAVQPGLPAAISRLPRAVPDPH